MANLVFGGSQNAMMRDLTMCSGRIGPEDVPGKLRESETQCIVYVTQTFRCRAILIVTSREKK